MIFPLSFSDISLWLAATAIVLLVTSELVYSLPEISSRLMINKKHLRFAALGCGLGFIITVGMRVFQVV
jgi:hypothetical protein